MGQAAHYKFPSKYTFPTTKCPCRYYTNLIANYSSAHPHFMMDKKKNSTI